MKNLNFLMHLIIVLTFFLPSISTGQQLGSDSSSKLIGSWYILSINEPGEIDYAITFHPDGSVSGDLNLFNLENAKWILKHEKINTPMNSIIIYDSSFSSDEWFVKKQYSIITFELKPQKNAKFFKSISSTYKKYMPPIQIIEIQSYNLVESGKGSSNKYICLNDENVDIISTLNNNEKIEANNTELKKLNKQSLKELVSIISNSPDYALRAEARKILNTLLDKKVHRYIQKKLKIISKYADYDIVFENGTGVCKLYEFLKFPIVYRNSISGEKLMISLEGNSNYENGFDIVCHVNGSELYITFKPYQKKLIIFGLSSGTTSNPSGWEIAATSLALSWNKYPDNTDDIDADLLENL